MIWFSEGKSASIETTLLKFHKFYAHSQPWFFKIKNYLKNNIPLKISNLKIAVVNLFDIIYLDIYVNHPAKNIGPTSILITLNVIKI